LIGERSTWEEDKSDIDPNSATAFVYNPHVSLSLEQQRERLPVFRNRNHILYLLEKFQTLVLVGETGCGKSTQVPQVSVIKETNIYFLRQCIIFSRIFPKQFS
jgi:ATP-dependent RNA helicase DDX35